MRCCKISAQNQTFGCHSTMLGSHTHQTVNSCQVDLPIACIWWLDLKSQIQNGSMTMMTEKQIYKLRTKRNWWVFLFVNKYAGSSRLHFGFYQIHKRMITIICLWLNYYGTHLLARKVIYFDQTELSYHWKLFLLLQFNYWLPIILECKCGLLPAQQQYTTILYTYGVGRLGYSH